MRIDQAATLLTVRFRAPHEKQYEPKERDEEHEQKVTRRRLVQYWHEDPREQAREGPQPAAMDVLGRLGLLADACLEGAGVGQVLGRCERLRSPERREGRIGGDGLLTLSGLALAAEERQVGLHLELIVEDHEADRQENERHEELHQELHRAKDAEV